MLSPALREQLAEHRHIEGPFVYPGPVRCSGSVMGYHSKEERWEALYEQIKTCWSFFA